MGVPRIQSLMWSHAALAADSELDCLRALITAAPRCWTVPTNSSLSLHHACVYVQTRKIKLTPRVVLASCSRN